VHAGYRGNTGGIPEGARVGGVEGIDAAKLAQMVLLLRGASCLGQTSRAAPSRSQALY